MSKRRSQRRQKRIHRTLKLYELYDNKCQLCEVESYRVGFFDFHHIVPEEKEANIGRMVHSSSWDAILKEVDKCMMLCPNCHRLEHIDMREDTEIYVHEETD